MRCWEPITTMSCALQLGFARATAATAATLVVACGGGGGSGTSANQPPVAMAKLSGEAIMNASTTFDTAGTSDPDGSIAIQSWDYGDGLVGTSNTHTYQTAGTYTARLTVTDDQGATASIQIPVTVTKCSLAGTQAAELSPFTALCVQTSLGEMVFEVYPTQAPVTASNFLQYVDSGFFNGLIFHRVISGFVIQGGGYQPGPNLKTPTFAPIALESNNGLQNWQYTLAMARTSDPNSATSQFFINLVDNHSLDYNPNIQGPNGYAVFGQVISGTSVVDAIGMVATENAGGLADVPVQDVVIRSVVRLP